MKLAQNVIDTITHYLGCKVVPENESNSGDMYWSLPKEIRLYVEREREVVVITTMNSESSSSTHRVLSIFHKTRHDIETKSIITCLQEHFESFKDHLNATEVVFKEASNRRTYDAIKSQQDKLRRQLTPLLQKPLSFKVEHNEVRVLGHNSQYLGAVVCDLSRSDAELVELLTAIVQEANRQNIQYLISERARIDSLLQSYGIVRSTPETPPIPTVK